MTKNNGFSNTRRTLFAGAGAVTAARVRAHGSEFFDTTRAQWNPETLEQEPSDGAAIQKIFAHANERAARCTAL